MDSWWAAYPGLSEMPGWMGARAPPTPKGSGVTQTLSAALVAAQGEMPKVPKNGRNPHFQSAFVTLDDLIDAVRPILQRHGLAFVQMPAALEQGLGLTTRILHTSGESIESTMPLLIGKADMQGAGSAITYGKRYMLAAMLGIAEGTDDDGNHASALSKPEGQPAAATPSSDPAPAGTSGSENAFQGPLASDAQIRRLWAIWRKTGRPDIELKSLILARTGQESTHGIPRSKYDGIISAIEAPAASVTGNPDNDIPF